MSTPDPGELFGFGPNPVGSQSGKINWGTVVICGGLVVVGIYFLHKVIKSENEEIFRNLNEIRGILIVIPNQNEKSSIIGKI